MDEFETLRPGWRLTTAQILYRIPDFRRMLQMYVWQNFDHLPDLPKLNAFLRFWQRSLDGPLHSVRVSVSGLLRPTDLRHVGDEYRLN